MSTAYNHMKRSHRSQRNHYMASSKRYVKNAQQHNVKEELLGPFGRLNRMIRRKGDDGSN